MHFLVVDDSALARRHVAGMLTGFEVDTAPDGREALKRVAARSYDVVMLDIFMPEMDGFELFRAIRRLRPAVPVIAMSAWTAADSGAARVDFLTMLLALGASAVLRKPFTREQMLEAVDGALAHETMPDTPRYAALADVRPG